MKKDFRKQALVPNGWLRVLLFSILLFLASAGLLQPIQYLYNFLLHNGNSGSITLDENDLKSVFFLGLMVSAMLIVSVLLVYLFRKLVDRRSFASLGYGYSLGPDAWAGLFLAPAILGLGSIILYFSKHLQWVDIDLNPKELASGFGIAVLVAFYEELVFRGYILVNLMESFGKWLSLALSALLFAAFHLGNPGMDILTIGNIFLAGLILGINYIHTRNLWFSFFFHLSWNFLQGPVLGYKVSGLNLPSLLVQEQKGDVLLTGGNFGFEGSVFDMALSLIAVLLLFLYYDNKHKKTAAAL